MATAIFSHCGDAVKEGCDPWDEHAELDALSEGFRLKRYDLKRKINRLQSPIVSQLFPDVTSTIFEFCLPDFTDNQLSPDTIDKEDQIIIIRQWRPLHLFSEDLLVHCVLSLWPSASSHNTLKTL